MKIVKFDEIEIIQKFLIKGNKLPILNNEEQIKLIEMTNMKIKDDPSI